MEHINDEQVKIEADASYRPFYMDSTFTSLPFGELGDREFELLSYLLLKEEINNSELPEYDHIALMQQGTECGAGKPNSCARTPRSNARP